MENTNQQNQQAANSITIQFRAVAPLEGSEESAQLWVGGRANSTRNIALSQPLPTITAQDVSLLPAESVAAFINDSFATYIKRVKTQRMDLGDSLTWTLPADGLELALTMLTALTEGTRTRKELTAATIRDAINSDEFKAAVATYCKLKAINPDAFKRLVIDEFLKGCTRSDYTIYASRAAIAAKATAHLAHLATVIDGADKKTARVLELAVQAITAAPVIGDDDLI